MLVSQILRQRYQIIELIGSGGFGDTYLAIDRDFPGQPKCVVKHLSPKNLDPFAVKTAQRLFFDEAETLSRLGEHDRIPRLYAYFEEDSQFYLVQEFIAGQELTSEFKPGERWSEPKVINLLQELLAILAVVHQEDTIHRDLKPANIMRRNDDGKLILIDFGAVKRVVNIDSEGKKNSTVAIGTPGYMPLEQAAGKPGKYSDIYALGMLAIQALTSLTSEYLPQESDRFKEILDEQQINISPRLKTVLSKMISWKVENRYADANEVLEALNHTDILPPPITPAPTDNSQQPPVVRSGKDLPDTIIIESNSSYKLPAILSALVLLIGGGIYAWRGINQPPKINYAQLEIYLQNQQWQQADEESDRLLLEIAGESSALDPESISEFPCESLQTIDELWTSNSQGRFGYTPQKKVYLETGNDLGEYTQTTYEAFGDEVAWRTFGVWSLYGDLKFTEIAPVGHLPSPGKVGNDGELRIREPGRLLSRFDECGL